MLATAVLCNARRVNRDTRARAGSIGEFLAGKSPQTRVTAEEFEKYFLALDPTEQERVVGGARSNRRVGLGSARVVYPLGDHFVVKLPMHPEGNAQNMAEAFLSTKGHEVTTRVVAAEPGGRWLVAERARRATRPTFVRFGRSLLGIVADLKAPPTKHEDEFVASLRGLVKAGLRLPDLAKVSSWGVVKRAGLDRLVLLDYGITQGVYDRFYR